MSSANAPDVIIIGGGIAGLTCLQTLHAQGVRCRLFEASGRTGGRIRTDLVQGFRLDRGFQVFLTAYPEAQQFLNLPALDLRAFEPGAVIRCQGRFCRLVDPWRRPRHLIATALSPAATLSDKLRVAAFRRRTTRGSLDDLWQAPEQSTADKLLGWGFSPKIMERFFRPFLGGVFLDQDLQTSSRMCDFVFRMFSLGDAALPASGMQMIPDQLAARVPSELIQTNCGVSSLDGRHVLLANGDRHAAEAIVVATSERVARQLLQQPPGDAPRRVVCLYFVADRPPIAEPILVLNGEGRGPINNLCVPSQVAPDYAPPGQSLVSVTVLEPYTDVAEMQHEVCDQLRDWFGVAVDSWRHLRTFQIDDALPSQTPPALDPVAKSAAVRDGVFVCGDYCDTASINGAMASGRRAAEAVAAMLNKTVA